MDWMLAPTNLGGGSADPDQRPHIGFGAWGGTGCSVEFLPDLTAWQAAGILPVFTAGTGGPNCGTMDSPADLSQAFTAGGTDESDVPTIWSGRGPSCWGRIKPEVAAPGVNIRSSYNDGDYTIWGGTAAGASAHLAGAAALVLSADPTLAPLDARPIITGTALCIEDLSCGGTSCPWGPNNVTGWGRIDAFEAVSLTVGGIAYDIPWLSESPVSGTVSANANVPIAVTFDTTGLTPGTYLGLLDVESNDPAMPHVSVPVTLTVELPPQCDPVDILTVTAEVSGCVASLSAALTGTAPYTYAWDLGAFAPSTAPTPTVNFILSGTYPYTLTVLNCSGAYSDTEPGQVTVVCPTPDVWFYVYLPIVLREY